MQDALVIAISLAATAWLARTLWKRLFAPPCQPPSAGPPGTDGFVPLDALTGAKNRGGPEAAPTRSI